MSVFDRRNFIKASAFAGVAVPLSSSALTESCSADVRSFGAQGDGVTDDTDSFHRAIRESNGCLCIPHGRFRITETIEIPLSEAGRVSLSGGTGTGTVIMDGPGPAFRFLGSHEGTSNPNTIPDEIWLQERMPMVENIEIEGDYRGADGLEFINTLQPTVRGVLIRDVRHGIILRERNRNFILGSSHIHSCRGAGLLMDHVNLHQAIVQGSHIGFCNKGGVRSVGSEIRNLQITGNDIEYNYDSDDSSSADIWIDVQSGSVREGAIVGNTIQSYTSYGGANIRFIGSGDTYNKIGLWSITGNHISNSYVNIHITRGRGFVIDGNSFVRGVNRNILMEEVKNIVIGSNSIDGNPDYSKGVGNGITIMNSEGVIISGLQLESDGPVNERYGVVEIIDSNNVTMSGCQIFDPRPVGVYVKGSRNIQIMQCQIKEESGQSNMSAAISVDGDSRNVIVQNNLTSSGTDGEISVEPGTSYLDGNRRLG